MIFSWTFIALLLSYTLLLFFLPAIPGLGYSFVIIIIAWLIDMILVLKEPKLTAERIIANPIYQHEEIEIKVVLSNPLARSIRVRFKDEPPYEIQLKNKSNPPVTTLKPKTNHSFKYVIVAPKRGGFSFGSVNVRYSGFLNLFSYQYQIPLPQQLIVYPNLSKIGDYRFHQLQASEVSGLHRQRLFSMSGEFAQLREFVAGDDFRKVNWKVTAHFGKPVVNEFEPEKDQNVFLCFDTGRMLFDQNDTTQSRMDYILDSALLLAYNIVEHGDVIGALGFNSRVDRYVPLGKGKSQIQWMTSRLYDMEAVMTESDYREAFRFLQSRVNKRSLLFVYTDISDAESSKDLINYLKIFSRHHLIVCILLKKDYLDTVIERPIQDESSAFLKGVALELQAERVNLKRDLSFHGIKVLEVTPDNIHRVVVEHYLFLKHKGLF